MIIGPSGIYGVDLGIENYFTIRASPICQRRYLRFPSARKGRDCGTINGYNESKKSISSDELNLLTILVNLLDAGSFSFAPHERDRSSRKRCVELAREKT